MSYAPFQPVIGLRETGLKTIRWGMMPSGKERSLGAVEFVPLRDSLRIYQAALHRTHIVCTDYVVVQFLDGTHVAYNWEGLPV